jgi:hypothetical protein
VELVPRIGFEERIVELVPRIGFEERIGELVPCIGFEKRIRVRERVGLIEVFMGRIEFTGRARLIEIFRSVD